MGYGYQETARSKWKANDFGLEGMRGGWASGVSVSSRLDLIQSSSLAHSIATQSPFNANSPHILQRFCPFWSMQGNFSTSKDTE